MKDDNNISSQQYVTFRLADEDFGVEVSCAREILSMVSVTQVPQMPNYLLGVINLRGQVVPVVDMRLKLGLPSGKYTEETCIIVFEVKVDDVSIVVGSLVDGVNEVLELRSDLIEPPPRLGAKLHTEFIVGMGKINEKFVILLNVDRIFSTDEICLVQSIVDDEPVELEEAADLVEA